MTLNEIINALYLYAGDIAVILLCINILLFAVKFRNLTIPLRRFFYFLIWSFSIEITARIILEFQNNNLPLLHLYTLGEFLLFSFFYKSILTNSVFLQKRYWTLILIGTVLIISNSIFIHSIFEFNPFAKTFVQIVVISFAIWYFYTLHEYQILASDTGKSLRLINSAVLIYYSGSLFIFMCNQVFFDNSELYKIFWAFNSVLNLIFQLLLLWAIWIVVFRRIPSSS